MNKNTRFTALVGLIGVAVAIIVLLGLPRQQRLQDPALPALRPSELTIAYSYSNGLSPSGSSAYLSENSSYRVITNGTTVNKIAFTVSPNELDELYQLIRSHHFETIAHTTQTINDGGAGTVSVGWKGGTISQPYGDAIVMSEADQTAIATITNAIASLIQRKMAAISVPVKIVRSSSVPKNATLLVSIDNSPDLVALSDAQHFVPGPHTLSASLRGSKITTPVQLNTTINLQGIPQTLTFSFNNSELDYTLR